jgi:hypothetical protein
VTPQEKTASATKPRLLTHRIKTFKSLNATRTLSAVLSIATMVAGLALMLTTNDATVYMLAACLVANEAAKDLGQ